MSYLIWRGGTTDNEKKRMHHFILADDIKFSNLLRKINNIAKKSDLNCSAKIFFVEWVSGNELWIEWTYHGVIG